MTAERALNKHLNGGCQVPIACYAVLEGEQLWLRGLVGQPDGSQLLRAEQRGSAHTAEALGVQVAEALLAQGAAAILQAVYGEAAARVSGWRLLLTRPAQESAALAAALAQQGIYSSSLPLLAIEALAERVEQRSRLADLHRYCAVIVVSKPAARLGLDCWALQASCLPDSPGSAWVRPPGRFFASKACWCIIPRRAMTVRRCWLCRSCSRRCGRSPRGVDPARRGWPRAALPSACASLGVQVDYLPLYRRVLPGYPPAALASGWRLSVERPGGQQWAGFGAFTRAGRRGLAAAGLATLVCTQPTSRRDGACGGCAMCCGLPWRECRGVAGSVAQRNLPPISDAKDGYVSEATTPKEHGPKEHDPNRALMDTASRQRCGRQLHLRRKPASRRHAATAWRCWRC